MHKLLLEATISNLLHQPKDALVKNTWKLADYYHDNETEADSFHFRITMIKGKKIWFQTWLESEKDREPKCLKSHQLDTIDSKSLASKIIDCNMYNISQLFNFTIEKAKSQKQSVKTVDTVETEIKIRRRCKSTVDAKIKANSQEHLLEPITDADKRQSKLERQLFNDPKMWKFKS